MGGGAYNYSSAVSRSVADGRASKKFAMDTGLADANYARRNAREVFSRYCIDEEMNPYNVKVRESRDSDEHPESLAIVLGLDVTGSMENVPRHLVGEGLPLLMNAILQAGVKDPQILFMGVGDHTCDQAPLQIGQFESSDELLEKWLTNVYLEGGGGGNSGESYLLAWYFAAMHTEIDCWDKRKQKGFLFTIGDEPPLMRIPSDALKTLMGPGQYENFDGTALLKRVRERYNVYHIHILETLRGRHEDSRQAWGQLLGDDLLVAQHHDEVHKLIAQKILGVLSKAANMEKAGATRVNEGNDESPAEPRPKML